jgi:hypothetical protein
MDSKQIVRTSLIKSRFQIEVQILISSTTKRVLMQIVFWKRFWFTQFILSCLLLAPTLCRDLYM